MADHERSGWRLTPQIVIGVAIVCWGLLLTASNLGWLYPGQVFRIIRYWPLAIIALGVSKFVSATCRSSRVWGGIITLVGFWLLSEEVYGFRIHVWRWWPLLLVFGGVAILARAFEARGFETEVRVQEPGAPGVPPGGAPQRKSRGVGPMFAFWSGIERRVSDPDFRHAECTAIMGGIQLDLRNAGTATGEAVVDVFALMGGIEITVPTDWAVENRIVPILGGVEDKSTGTQASQHRLILQGAVLMGGVEVKT